MILDNLSSLGGSPSGNPPTNDTSLRAAVGLGEIPGLKAQRIESSARAAISESLLKPHLVPPFVRILARECAEAGIAAPLHNSWRIFLETVTVEQPVRGAFCAYSVEGLTLNSTSGLNLTRAACETTLRVRSPLQGAIELVAPMVVFHVPVQMPMSIHANVLVSYHALPEGLVTLHTQGAVVHILTPAAVPSSLAHATVHQYDTPRVALAPDAKQTTEMCGFSIWHLLALGLLQGDIVDEFLASLEGIEVKTLVADLMETMTFLNENAKEDLAKMNLGGLEWEEVRAITAFRTPFELCAQTRRAFLTPYAYDSTRVPPIVAKFISDTKSFIQ